MKFDDKSFAFVSDIDFKPDLRAILNEEHLDYLLGSSWEKSE